MKICSRCLYSELHPLNITFDEEGVCSGCRIHEEKDLLDWNARFQKLKQITENYRNQSGNNYDCIVPVSGARDSYFIVHTVKNVLGLNPLLVTYNKHYNTDLGIRNLANLRIKFNLDIMTLTVSPETVKKITRGTLRKMGSIYWHCIAGQTVYPVQVAVKFKIPLIIWGAHQGIDQVGMFSHLNEVEMTRKYRKEHDLMGFEAEDLIDEFDGIEESDIVQFRYPHDKEIERIGVRGIYLNNYIRWDSKAQHEKMIELYDYETGEQTRTFDTYNDVDCFNYSDVHDYIKFIKHGYGKVTDHVCREIRLRRLSREDGIKLIKEYSIKEPKNLNQFLNWIGMTKNGFKFILDQHRSPKIWFRNENWEWELKNPDPFQNENRRKSEVDQVRLALVENECKFRHTPNKRTDFQDEKYILIGKGYYQ
ncbi:N-acetyl sugar amidotransferase [Leptospira bandrabouensis]|uniref:N-acetyl sugar amidotransferase n=1 Tax=Leptospira bandrabouensis TaxID=2484903 RepID=A0A6H3NRH8_9LEPT|nr:N-acetyl sugar amidotransferase [Leptospira bandrabouensis]MCG6152972.1 N-acetyl sugar amidotransferase [Leptospira bandrabouensis]TGN03774.1 N-acetyl sugar amidotransferase [Leptospira bandrabouensis]TGN12200.1 N-acetyl sugar amidotransferase [Leptospira bandrabouensis]